MEIIILIALLIMAVMVEVRYDLFFPKRYKNRKCTGKKWKTAFPDAQKEELRKFLNLFTDAFAFSQKNKLKFEPTDGLLEIYREVYPSKWMPDGLELETLAESIEKEYGVSFNDIWHENLTLGELFKEVKNA